jgi:hypothetical protein
MALTPAEAAFVATHEVPVVTAMKPYLNDSREAYSAAIPRPTVPPTISGTGAIGAVHIATPGTWTNSPAITYQWRRDGVPIAGATAATYTTTTADSGALLTCAVTATNAAGSTTVVAGPIRIATLDNVVPVSVTFSPVDNQIGVAVGVNLVVTFSETVTLGTGIVTLKKVSDNSTITSWNVATQAGTGAGQVNVVGGNQLTLRPSTPLPDTTDFYVIWDANVVKDAANNPVAAMASPSLWNFTTVVVSAPDVTPPTATIFNPSDNSVSVSVTTDLVATMSETVVLGSAGTITLKKTSDNSVVQTWNVATDAGATAGKVNVVGGNLLTMRLTAALANSIEYYVTWTAGVVQDTSANPIAAQAVTTLWSFTTAVAGDVTPPTVVSFSPLDNATGVALSANLVATMSETVTLGTSGIITLKKTSDNSTVDSWNVATAGGSTAGKVEIVGGTALTMHLTTALANSLGVYVIWDAGVVKDTAGNPIAANAVTTLWNFTTVAAGGTFLLDLYPTASMAYSFRKLRNAYAGSAVRIRRSSDNLELNIGFDGSGNFDSAAAATHIGGGSGFIVTWFDQSGNGIDVTQATVANQPTYSATGMNALPTMVYDGNDVLVRASTSFSITTTTIMIVLLDNTSSSATFSWGGSGVFQDYAALSGTIYFDFGNQTAGSGRISIAAPSGWTVGSHLLEFGREVGNDQFITVDGAELIRGTGRTVTPGAGPNTWSVGENLGAVTYHHGPISELVIWAADLAANRTAARGNIQTYWLPPAFTGLLDTYPTASMAYSFRKLRNAYAGSAVRIRRSSDNLELNVGFLANGDFDSAAAATHIGGGTGFIVTWFDQSGNAIDVTQATVANQPAYVAAGMNSLPTMATDSTDFLAVAGVANTSLPAATTTAMTVMTQNSGTTAGYLGWEAASSVNRFSIFKFNANITFDFGNNSTGDSIAAAPADWLTRGGRLLEVGRDTANSQYITLDGVEKNRAAGKVGLPAAGSAILSVPGWPAVGNLVGTISEMVVWAADLGASRASARWAVQSYWLAAPPPSPLLDVLSTPATRAYSTRKLSAAYAGSAIRIRRSSDNAEQDIGFVSGHLDAAAITAFVGANSAYVVKMYDQSGGAFDTSQATVASQARIVNAGVLETKNGRYLPYFDGTDDFLAAASAVWSVQSAGVVAAADVAGTTFPHAIGVFGGSVSMIFVGQNAATGYYFSGNVGGPNVNNTGAATLPFNGTLHEIRATSATGIAGTTETVQLGKDRGVPAAVWLGWIGEAVAFATQLSASDYQALYENQKTYWNTEPTARLLDQLGVNATRAYSTRKLRAAYTGSAIRIRRSSDNAELDIGFSGEDLNTAAVATFVGANSAYVVKWYDQSGSADNCVQATVASQPRIVNAGTLDVRNTKAAPLFDAVDDYLQNSTGPTVQEAGVLVATSQAGPNFSTVLGAYSSVTQVMLDTAGAVPTWDNNFTAMKTVFAVNNVSTFNAVFGGVLQQIDQAATSPVVYTATQIGGDRLTAGRYWPGWIGEIVLFSAALTSGNRTAMYTNQKTYWGTP